MERIKISQHRIVTSTEVEKTRGKNYSHQISKGGKSEPQVKSEWKKNLPGIQEAMKRLEELKQLDEPINNISTLSNEDYQTINEEVQKNLEELEKDLIQYGLSEKPLLSEETSLKESPKQKKTEEKSYSGLSRMHHKPFIAKPGQYEKGQVIGEQYIFEAKKDRGVEPGFIGTLKIEDEKLKNWIGEHWDNEVLHNARKELVTQDKEAPSPLNKDQYEAYIKDHEEEFTTLLMVDSKVIEEFKKANPKYSHKHYVKLDYDEPIDGKVSIPLENAKTLSGVLKTKGLKSLSEIVKKTFPSLDKIIQEKHQQETTETIRDKNEAAMREAFANDLFTILGVSGQELCLVKAKYEDGETSKLLLDGTHITGPNGEKFRTFVEEKIFDSEGIEIDRKTYIKKGRLVKNGVEDENGDIHQFDEDDLAKALTLSLLFGDRDKVGSSGGNIGFIIDNNTEKARLMNLDPGKSLEKAPKLSTTDMTNKKGLKGLFLRMGAFFTGQTDRMRHRNLNNDFSFTQPNETLKDKLSGGYKNFTIFQDTKLSEKMKAMQSVVDNWGEVEKLFDAYRAEFGEGDLNFKTEIDEMQARLTERKEYFEGVLRDRLDLLGNKRGAEMIDLLDNVEKLTSGTVIEVGKGKNSFRLQHLMVKPEERKPWKLVVKDKQCTLIFEPKNKQEELIVKNRFMSFYGKVILSESESKENNIDSKKMKKIDLFIRNENRIEFSFPESELDEMLKRFDEKDIIKHKHGEKYIKQK